MIDQELQTLYFIPNMGNFTKVDRLYLVDQENKTIIFEYSLN